VQSGKISFQISKNCADWLNSRTNLQKTCSGKGAVQMSGKPVLEEVGAPGGSAEGDVGLESGLVVSLVTHHPVCVAGHAIEAHLSKKSIIFTFYFLLLFLFFINLFLLYYFFQVKRNIFHFNFFHKSRIFHLLPG
jgi:hypothetical protein